MSAHLLGLLGLLLACTGGGAGHDSGLGGTAAGSDGGGEGGGDGGGVGDGGTSPAVAIYPDGDRVLLYYGHGGMAPQTTGKASFKTVEARWDALGYNLHHKDTLPDDLTIYRLIGLVAPGSDGDATFSADEVDRLEAARRGGTRIAVLGDPLMCDDAGVADLLLALHTDAGFNGDSADTNQVVTATDIAQDQQPSAGVGTLRMRDPCYALVGRGAALARDSDGTALASLHRPSDGGDIVILGDLEVLDDGYIDREDNAILADNLALVEP